ncbi:diaminopropionate ammonia-lyase [Ralstonia sp. A12]|uniref:diaminopropionate ammonia-lyase n=1 Tax=Ralstonia sp. A12 TaxID=1217052 RepID=UPI000575BF46|nr:diaminopropionate ammonia-lyase [Ralstonia sp. A12]KHK49017.1 diaminopropionate ammonia-lyase [Ralstonia sp. A12]
MLIANQRASHSAYPAQLKAVMSVEKAEESRKWLSSWEGINRGATPLFDLPNLAAKLGVAQVLVKDESTRSPLGSFKALGAPIALVRLILRLWPEDKIDPIALFAGEYKTGLANFTVISATDGNHGKALAAAARSIGCRCMIVLHANVSVEREEAIAAYGAEILRIQGNYDESVAEAARLAKASGWHVVSDTSYEGYEEIPRDVMQGYGTVAAEIVESCGTTASGTAPFTHVFLQGGVGGMAAGIASYFWETYGEKRPTFVIVEPEQADCLYQSAIQGTAAKATGSVDSVMAGLACGETSPLAWRFLETGTDYFMTIRDEDAVRAMQLLARGSERDIPIVSGESGAAGLAGLVTLGNATELAAKVGLNRSSRVLLISTEGATAPSFYAQLVGESANAVVLRQKTWAQTKAA